MEIFKSWPFFAAFEKLIELRCLIPKDMISSHIELLPYLSLEGKGGRGRGGRKEGKGLGKEKEKKKALCSLSKVHKARKLSSSRTQDSDPVCYPGEGRGLDAGGGMVRLPGSGPPVGGEGASPRYQEMQGNERPELSGYSGAS